ncbi:T6SS immunity protein Tli4 family protein [Amantichitinum ursilacus]|uniref:Tle cognate immunity protein 4 C-terminal domain-containing protein n=1 Tax=Amantichitinum ursilacus TaxID=857265 RepID=A0A0N1JSL7_9NEIS|nr:T6SS immunity protein Tli4 family protein [Amantichitinum ursilacus]KPC52606.1 hypothetical protein WG78_12200 [Amantichitinum ursilacus]
MLIFDRAFCFGYHQIAVSADATLNVGQPVTYDNFVISTHPNAGRPGYQRLIKEKENFYAAPGVDGQLTRDSRELFAGAHSVVIGQAPIPEDKIYDTPRAIRKEMGGDDYYSTMFLYPGPASTPDQYRNQFVVWRIDDSMFLLKFGEDETTRLNTLYQNQTALLKRFRPRGDFEVPGPDQHGVCIDDGFIADANDGKGEHFFKTPFASATFPTLPGVRLHVSVNVGSVREGDYLFDRKPPGFVVALFDAFKLRTLRKAERNINGVAGQELLTAWKSEVGEQFLFVWESTENPRLAVRMEWGKQQGAPERQTASPLNEKDALAVWDALLPTLKRRPVQGAAL